MNNKLFRKKISAIDQLHADLFIFSVLVLVSIGCSIKSSSIFYYSLITIGGYTLFLIRYFYRSKIRFPGSIANMITLIRWAGLMTITFFQESFEMRTMGILFSCICVADLFDGYLARKLNQVTTIGEYLDKETDALFVMSLSLIIYIRGLAGVWILAFGLIRYVYFIILYFRISTDKKEYKFVWAQWIAVIVFVSLLGAFFFPMDIMWYVLVFAFTLLLFSFLRGSFYEFGLLKTREF